MKPLFNLDPKFNGGFQIDMSQLTQEQRNHVLQMFILNSINPQVLKNYFE